MSSQSEMFIKIANGTEGKALQQHGCNMQSFKNLGVQQRQEAGCTLRLSLRI